MISIFQVALGGLVPPIFVAHVALAGMAPFEQAPPDELPTIEIQRPSGGALMSWHLARQISRRRRIDEDEALLLAVLK